MNEEPEWNWKAVVAGALSNPLIVFGIGVSVVLQTMLIVKGQVPAHEVGLSDEERDQQRAEIRRRVDEMHAENKTDEKIARLAPYIKIGSAIVGCSCGLLQGYAAGRMAKKHPLAHAAASEFFGYGIFITMRALLKRNVFLRDNGLFDKKRSFKSQLLGRILSMTSVLLGGYLSRRK